jgi:DNA-binding CsgD family transcriptional regulator
VSLCGTSGADWHAAHAMTALGIALWRTGDVRRATAMEEQGLRFNRAIGDPLGSVLNLEVLTWIAATEQDHERAARLLGFLRATERVTGAPLAAYPHLARHHAECESATREALGEPAFQAAVQAGAGLPYCDALTFALREGKRTVREERPDHPVTLTRREAETARLVARGLTNKEIAAALVIAERTAEGHVGHVLDKLGFTSRAQIAAWVAEHGENRDS